MLYTASDNSIAKLVAPLTLETAQGASNSLLAFSVMLKENEQKGLCEPGLRQKRRVRLISNMCES